MQDLIFNIGRELLQVITLVKVAVAVSMVVILSLIAEFVSPRVAGIISGYPLGAAIVLFFIGLEISSTFAAESAVYTILGLIATQCFAYAYYKVSLLLRSDKKLFNILVASFISSVVYTVIALVLRYLKVNLWLSLTLATCSILFFDRLLKKIKDVKIDNIIKLSTKILLLRACVAALIIVVITSIAKLVGPNLAGLFSAFPITMLPFIAIIHYTYDTVHVHSIIKNIPRGIFSLLVYSFAVAVLYPSCGVYVGTLVAYVFATIYLILITGGLKAGRIRSYLKF